MKAAHDIVDEQAMAAFGAALAAACEAAGLCVIYLIGELGAGKTTLVRSMLRAMGWQGPVKSPTYTLIESYDVAGRPVHHLDLYRLSDPDELAFLGLRDLLQSTAMVLVEWPQRGEGALPAADVIVAIEYADQGRRMTVTAQSAVGEQMIRQLGER